MKINPESLEFESIVLRKEMANNSWYKGFCTASNASKIKLRLEQKTLHRNTIKDLMEWFKYEMVVDPVEGMYRKLEIRRYKVSNANQVLKIMVAETGQKAIDALAIELYGQDEMCIKYDGTQDYKWKLAVCDLTAEEVI
jgi:hypothetical protein